MTTPNTRKKSVSAAAIRHAKLGHYVGPLKPATKVPGSRLGKGWHNKTSNDPKVVSQWYTDHPKDGLFLHLGQSGLIAFDLDVEDLNELPQQIADALRLGLFQRSRGKVDRGHYVFATPESFGNSAGGFAGWGDVRGKNGVIVLAPTIHPVTGEPYELVRGNWDNIPELPAVLRSLIRSGGQQQQPALTASEFEKKVLSLTSGTQHGLLEKHCLRFRVDVADGESRHQAMLRCSLIVMQETREGHYPAADAIARLRQEFEQSFSNRSLGRRSAPAKGEFEGLLRWASAQPTPSETLVELFDSTDELRMIRRYAEEHSVAPVGLLAAGLLRALICLPPRKVLPPIVGKEGPVNLFVALVGPSGAGKGATEDLAQEVFELPDSVLSDLHIGRPGSSEGIAKMYGRMQKALKSKLWKPVYKVSRVLASLPEVDTLAALLGRDGSHLSATLRELWTGSRIGYDYAHVETQFTVGAKRYRFCLLIGVQPERAGTIIQGQAGGLPQRFLWAGVTVPPSSYVRPSGDRSDLNPIQLPEVPGESEDTLAWRDKMLSEAQTAELECLTVPEEAKAQILRARELNLQGLSDDKEGHRLFLQCKIAVGFAVIHGRVDGFSSAHWEQAGLLLEASDTTYRSILHAIAEKRTRGRNDEAREAGRLRGIRSHAEEEAISKQVRERIIDVLGEKESTSQTTLKRRLSRRQREFFDVAIAALKDDKLIGVKRRAMQNGERSTHYFLRSAP
ncbi:hypothetical protein G7068_06690 [Leucobacter viscericola]|uniref:DNA primase/polymerase bifunctional N-terminal domain-containing protein n=1 Tax=Leucobacter viscericola TaxID=2714935 RepID=A0A6G7XEX6_9MICO|nr:bifunctional DNA primase/polymerase [Leucobacter viscericola]QIK62921.1 hypothetical protein G7068_06690 [Leucobacter viscericola]